MQLLVLLGLACLATVAYSQAQASCYFNSSTCTPQFGTAGEIYWRSCEHYCQKCQGRAIGKCTKVSTAACCGGFQCRCSGKKVVQNANAVEAFVCTLGLDRLEKPKL